MKGTIRREVAQLGTELWASARDRRPVRPISARYPDFTLSDAYAVQREVRALEVEDGAVLVGHKIGATSVAIQEMFGIDHPDFGYLTDRMLLTDGAHLDPDRFISPKVEGEVAFRMGGDLAGSSVTAQDVLAAAYEVLPVLEVLDSRIDNWKIQLVDTVADNASSAMVVLGAAVPVQHVDLATERMVFQAGGFVETGYGSAVMGHPAESVACLVRILSSYGTGLSAGDMVLAGSWTAAVDLLPGSAVGASFDSLGAVSLTVNERRDL
jgi:2-keto-4-pentenoate hydratase